MRRRPSWSTWPARAVASIWTANSPRVGGAPASELERAEPQAATRSIRQERQGRREPLERDTQVLGLVGVGEGDVDIDADVLLIHVAVAVHVHVQLHHVSGTGEGGERLIVMVDVPGHRG